MVEIEKIRELVGMMSEHELSEIELRDGEQTILIKRGGSQVTIAPTAMPVALPAALPAAPIAPAASNGGAPDYAAQGLVAVASPMVGTFYAAADPDSPPFVTVGSTVVQGTVVCIIEAMKVFNEIKSEVSGTIEKIMVDNQQAVEFGQPLFLVRPRA